MNPIEKLYFFIRISNRTVFPMCTEKADIIFRLKGIEIYIIHAILINK